MALSHGAFLSLGLVSASAGTFRPDGLAKTERFSSFPLYFFSIQQMTNLNLKRHEYGVFWIALICEYWHIQILIDHIFYILCNVILRHLEAGFCRCTVQPQRCMLKRGEEREVNLDLPACFHPQTEWSSLKDGNNHPCQDQVTPAMVGCAVGAALGSCFSSKRCNGIISWCVITFLGSSWSFNHCPQFPCELCCVLCKG